jgi:hypothetical protein
MIRFSGFDIVPEPESVLTLIAGRAAAKYR